MLTTLEIEGQAFRSTQKEQNMEGSWVQKSKAYLWDMQVKKKKKRTDQRGRMGLEDEAPGAGKAELTDKPHYAERGRD